MSANDKTVAGDFGTAPCEFIRRLADEDLERILSESLLGLDLLDHAAQCDECGPRVVAVGEAEFSRFPAEEKERYLAAGRRIASRVKATPSVDGVPRIGSSRKLERAEDSTKALVSLPLAATTEKIPRSDPPGGLSVIESFDLDDASYDLCNNRTGDVFVRGPLPEHATHIGLGDSRYALVPTDHAGIRRIEGIGAVGVQRHLTHKHAITFVVGD